MGPKQSLDKPARPSQSGLWGSAMMAAMLGQIAGCGRKWVRSGRPQLTALSVPCLEGVAERPGWGANSPSAVLNGQYPNSLSDDRDLLAEAFQPVGQPPNRAKIVRAPWRERGCQYV